MKKRLLAVLFMAAMVLSLVACGEDSEQTPSDNESDTVENSIITNETDDSVSDTTEKNIENNIEEISEDYVINKFIELYNESSVSTITDVNDMDIHGTDYRTEFRLGAFDNAIGKKGNIQDATIEIINYGHFSNDSIRIYITNSTEDVILDSYKTIIHIFDSNITDEKMMDEFDAASIYLGETGDITGYAHKTELFLDCDELNFIDIK